MARGKEMLPIAHEPEVAAAIELYPDALISLGVPKDDATRNAQRLNANPISRQQGRNIRAFVENLTGGPNSQTNGSH